MATFRESLEKFEEANDWLTDSDLPALTALYAIADTLDSGDLQAPLVSQFGLSYRSLLKRAPKSNNGPVDPLEAALGSVEASE